MNELVFVNDGQAVTDSLTVAEVFGKEHKNVLSDIRKQSEYAGREFAALNFKPGSYLDKNNQTRPKICLTEEAFTLVAMSYNTKESVRMKVKFIQEFKRMRESLSVLHAPSYMILDPIKRAEKWIEEETKRKVLEQQVAESKPKVTYYDEILSSKGVLTITQIAKDYGMSGQALNELLHNNGVQYKQSGQWLLYRKHQDSGYTKSETRPFKHKNGDTGTRLHTKWTQKGRLFIHNLLSKLDIEPLMDRNEESLDAATS